MLFPVLMAELSKVTTYLKLEKDKDDQSSNVMCEVNLVENHSKVYSNYTGVPSYVLLTLVFDFSTVGIAFTFSDSQCSRFQQTFSYSVDEASFEPGRRI